MVVALKGQNHVRDVPFTYIFMYYFPNRPWYSNPTMKREGFQTAAENYFEMFCKALPNAIQGIIKRCKRGYFMLTILENEVE
ncbi:MAG: hypothetical protein WA610_07885 [Thermodesulfovibrionales bacterium]